MPTRIVKHIIENKKLILLILFSPVLIYVSTILIRSFFNIGVSVGTFLRHLYHYVVC